METPRRPAAPTLDYAPPAGPAVSWSELWTYREPILVQHPRLTWRIALVLVLLSAFTPILAPSDFDARMLFSAGLTAFWWAFLARLALDVLVVAARALNSRSARAPTDGERR